MSISRHWLVQPWEPNYEPLRRLRIKHMLETRIVVNPDTGCHEWTGARAAKGYGKLGRFQDPWGGYAHRAALYVAGVPLLRGYKLHVRHRCDNPICVNVAHLVYGTAAENVQDSFIRGRRKRSPYASRAEAKLAWQRLHPAPRRERRSWKLTAGDVAEIRKALLDGESQSAIAARYLITQATVSSIATRRTWKHVAGPAHTEAA